MRLDLEELKRLAQAARDEVGLIPGPKRTAFVAATNPAAILVLIERVERAEVQGKAPAEDLRLVNAGPGVLRDGKSAFRMTFQGAKDAMLSMAEAMVTFFRGEGGVNYVEVKVHHRTEGDFILCVQRSAGKTPHELRRDAERKAGALEKSLRALAKREGFDGVPCWCDGRLQPRHESDSHTSWCAELRAPLEAK